MNNEILNFISDLEGKYNLPSGSFRQIVSQESAFKPNLTSPAGARGYSQLMPATAAAMGVKDITDPYQNLEGGAKYYSQLLNTSAQGDPVVAAAMYNSGPNRRAYKVNDMRLLPRETQNYMTKFKTAFENNTQAKPTKKMTADDLLAEGFEVSGGEQAQPKMTAEDLLAQGFVESGSEQPVEKPVEQAQTAPRSINADLALEALSNVPSSATNTAWGVIQSVMHPLDTVSGLANIAQGAIYKARPDLLAQKTAEFGPESTGAALEAADAMAKRYGGKQELIDTFATDPVGLLSDISGVAGLAKGVAKTGAKSAKTIADYNRDRLTTAQADLYTNPAGLSAEERLRNVGSASRSASATGLLSKAAEKVASGAEKAAGILNVAERPIKAAYGAVEPVLGAAVQYPLSLISGIEKPSFSAAFEAGKKSVRTPFEQRKFSSEQAAFMQNLSGKVPEVAAVETAKNALSNLRSQMSDAYKTNMSELSTNSEVLDFQPITDAFSSASTVKTFGNKVLDPSANKVKGQIGKVLQDWQSSDPAVYHTASGFDALKQRIGDIRESTEPNSPSRLVVDKVYQSITKTIKEKNPEYAAAMEDYSTRINQIKEIEKELSLKENVNPSTALRKLQSVMRNNANTAWSRRVDLVNSLKDAGATNLEYTLAGQSMNSLLPRGLGRLGATGSALAAGSIAGAIPALGSLVLSSPKVAGLLANTAGRGAGVVGLATDALTAVPARGLLTSSLNQQQKKKKDE